MRVLEELTTVQSFKILAEENLSFPPFHFHFNHMNYCFGIIVII